MDSVGIIIDNKTLKSHDDRFVVSNQMLNKPACK